MAKTNETRARSLAKAVSYRIICIVMLAIVTYAFTSDLYQMTAIVVVFQSIQMVLYYIHERAWDRVTWGHVGTTDGVAKAKPDPGTTSRP